MWGGGGGGGVMWGERLSWGGVRMASRLRVYRCKMPKPHAANDDAGGFSLQCGCTPVFLPLMSTSCLVCVM